jgi:hypothetical protein
MAASVPDLSRLRLDRDTPPPGVRKAIIRNVVLAGLVVLGLAAAGYFIRRGRAVPVRVVAVAGETGPRYPPSSPADSPISG